MNAKLNEYISLIEKELYSYLPRETTPQKRTALAMKHSLSAGGKRLRPVLVLEFCRMCGGNISAAIPVACALEMMHTFSLIHDDMPCMDDDDFRRGKPSCHKAFDEPTALLAGDALAILPFEIIADGAEKGCYSAQTAVKIISDLAKAVGTNGMIGGQQLDMEYEKRQADENELLSMYSMKTSALLETACVCGCLTAGADSKKILAAREYAAKMGLAFQITDDILDVCGDESFLGKPVGSDEKSGKTTTVTLYGIEKAERIAQDLIDEATEALAEFEDNAFLVELTLELAGRKK